jgi:serine/threonine-protein kinase
VADRRAEDLATEVLARPTGEREAYLETQCAGDPGLRRQVEALLERRREAFAWFDDLGAQVAASASLELEASRQEMRVGPYRTVRVLGHGGMGTVFLAERADGQFDQRVALKLIRLGRESEETVRRFLAERQILARLQHPHIARLLDGGVDGGRPYFVMEYVEGLPLGRYCDERRLSVEERLRVFVTVCEAVQDAHRSLVVHRDLKPTNVLVTAGGTVKLLDFGIAKVLAQGVPDTGDPTVTGSRALTPGYAAPEQFRGEAPTTATDVYSLGVILYELLCGRAPFPVRGRSPGEVERAILEAEPEPPSRAARRTQEGPGTPLPEELAAARSTTAGRLPRRLAGELDAICLTALRKEPARRYLTADRLADDVRRHLEGLPLRAHRDSLGYRAGKFMRRHRWGVAAASLLGLLVVGFAAAMAVQSARVSRERDKARRVADLFVDTFRLSDPAEARGETITARELLDRGAHRIDGELGDQPEVQASLLVVLGRVYQNLGLFERAAPLLTKALAARRQVLGPSHPDLVESLNSLGELLRQKGDYRAAEPILREALATSRRLFGAADPRVAETLNHLGKVRYAQGAYPEAEAAVREALAIQRGALPAGHADLGESLNNLATVVLARGDQPGAESLFREALAVRRQALGPDHALVAASLNNLALVLQSRGAYDEAEGANREALAVYRKLFPDDNPRVATVLNNLGLSLYLKGDYAGAEPVFRESLAMRRRLLSPSHPEVAQSASNLGLLLQGLGRHDEAEALYRESLAVREKALGADHPLVAGSLNNLGLLFQARGRHGEAQALFAQGRDLLVRRLGPAHALVATSLSNLGSVALDRGRLEAAEALYQESLSIRRKSLRAGHPDLAYSLLGLGRLALARHDAEAAEPLLR